MESRGRNWNVTKVFCRKESVSSGRGLHLRRRGETVLVDIEVVTGLQIQSGAQSAANCSRTTRTSGRRTSPR